MDAQLAAREVALLEVKKRERSYARRDLAILAVQDRAQEQSGSEAASGATPFPIEAPLSEPSADLGWLQANSSDSLSFFDTLLDLDLSFLLNLSLGPNLAAFSAASSTPLLVSCSL